MEKPIVNLEIDMVATVFRHIVAQIEEQVDALDHTDPEEDAETRKNLVRNLFQLCLLEETYCVTIGDDDWFLEEELANRVELYLKERGSSWNDVRTKAGLL